MTCERATSGKCDAVIREPVSGRRYLPRNLGRVAGTNLNPLVVDLDPAEYICLTFYGHFHGASWSVAFDGVASFKSAI